MKVLVTATNYSKYCQPGKKMLEAAGCEIVENPYGRPYTFEELKAVIGDIDGVVAGVDTWDENVFKIAPRLKVIARFGVGVDNISLEDAKKFGIRVCNCPGINSSAVAEQAVALMLCVLRDIPGLNAEIRKGLWPRPMFHEMKSRTVGFLGFGAIARNVAERLQGFHPRMIAYDTYPNQEAARSLGVTMVSLEEVLREADIISVHLPATKETRHLICSQTISMMKQGVILINTARGSVICEADAAEAMRSGQVLALGTDVFEKEPVDLNGELFQLRNYIATPHVSAETYENCETTSVATADAVLAVFDGREPKNCLV